MKLKDIAEQYGLDQHSLETFVLHHCTVPVNLTGIMRDSIDNESVPAVVDAYRDYLQERKTAKNAQDQQIREWRKSWEKAKEEYRTAAESIVMTTCPQIDGYRAVEQLGLVFGESLFKAGISSQVDALFDDAAPSPSIVDSELADTTDMLRKARERATMKMVLEAASRGANAIIGIDTESSISGSIMQVTMVGTAVRVAPVETDGSQETNLPAAGPKHMSE